MMMITDESVYDYLETGVSFTLVKKKKNEMESRHQTSF